MKYFTTLNIDFIGKRWAYYTVSIAITVVAVAGLIYRGGPVLGIDFTGGTAVQIGFKTLPPLDKIRSTLSKDGWGSFALQTQPDNNIVIVRIKSGPEKSKDIAGRIVESLKKEFSGNVKDLPDRVDFVGAPMGKKLLWNTLWAILGSLIGIVIYVAFRFKNPIWGIGGVIALAHDVFITFGFMTLVNTELTVEVVAALLTLAGYSINDTIVIFDRIREEMTLSRKLTAFEIFNKAINETLSRTINTSMTVLLAALCLTFWGGETIYAFSLCLTFGVIIGTYSSIGVASALVYDIEYAKKK